MQRWVGVVFLVAVACGFLAWGPWHGPILLSFTPSHGVDAGDLPTLALLALAVGLAEGQTGRAGVGVRRARWLAPALAITLGALLLAVLIPEARGEPLLPAGGGTFAGATRHTDTAEPEPVHRWSHVALTYDGTMLRLYVNGSQVSSRPMTGTLLKTPHALWIGGNHPYGEYFQGVIDEARVYDRALRPGELRAEMSAPIAHADPRRISGLVGAYGFDRGSAAVAADSSGKGNAGRIIGASPITRGRFGRALRFDGSGQLVRVPASASLNLRNAMTLSAWIRPSRTQNGWRTILARQTDAYFLMAGGGRPPDSPGAPEDARVVLIVGAAAWLCVLAIGRVGVDGRRRSLWPLLALFLAGSLIDVALAPSGTLAGPTFVAIWLAITARHRGEAAIMWVTAALLSGLTILPLIGYGGLEIARDDGGVARSAALGALLVLGGALGALYERREGGRAHRYRLSLAKSDRLRDQVAAFEQPGAERREGDRGVGYPDEGERVDPVLDRVAVVLEDGRVADAGEVGVEAADQVDHVHRDQHARRPSR